MGLEALKDRKLGLRLFPLFARGLGGYCRPVQALLHRDEISEKQLGVDHLHIAHRVHRAVHVDDVFVDETPNHVSNRVDLSNMTQELIAQALALGGALDQSGDVHELEGRGDH